MDDLLTQDIDTSLHIRNGVYVLGNDLSRKYINVDPKRCSEVSPLFQFAPLISSKRTFMQGRHFPAQAAPEKFELESVDQISIPKRSQMYERLENLKGKLFDVGSLVCEKNASSRSFQCSELGNKLSNNIIFASTRIVKDPYNAVIELIANSIDAYQEERAIGKFGMGFFAIVNWILKDNSNTIEISSFCKENEEYYAYVATIFMKDSRLSFTIDPLPEGSELTGTRIKLSGNLKVNDIVAFEAKIKFLRYSGTSILAKDWVCQQPDNKDLIVCSFGETSRELIIEDYATGIPLEVLISKTLIPSVSTKTILGSSTNSYRVPSMVVPRPYGGFGILVNGVLVYYAASETSQWDIILSLPANIKIVTSRDDVVLENDLQYAFDELFDKCVGAKCVFELQTLIEEYCSFTFTENYQIVQGWLKDSEARYSNVLVMGDLGLLPGLVKSKVQDLDQVYQTTLNVLSQFEYRGELYVGKKVYVVDIPFPEDPENYFPDLVVISADLVKKLGENWVSSLTYRYFKVGKLNLLRGEHPSKSQSEIYYHYVVSLIQSLGSFATFVDLYAPLEQTMFWVYKNIGDELFIKLSKGLAVELSTYKPLNVYGQIVEKFCFQNLFLPLYDVYKNGGITLDLLLKATEMEVDLLISTFKHRISQPVTFWMPHNGCFTGQVLGYVSSYVTLIEKSQNFIELYWLYRVFELAKYDLSSSTSVDVILSRIRDRNPGPASIVMHYLGLQSIEDVILVEEVTLVFQTKLPEEYQEPVPKGTSLKASELTSYIFNHSLDQVKEMLESGSDLDISKNSDESQIINIAVNYLSPQNWIDSVIDECVRNAVEAFYWAKEEQGYVNVSTRILKTDRYQLCVSFTDTVGMDFESFVAIGVPFFSTKNQAGGGFFKVYRHSSKVEVVSNGLKWVDYPLNFPPTDIQKYFSKEDVVKGTTISIYLDVDISKAQSRIRYRLEQIYGQSELRNFDIRFEGVSVIKARRFIESFGDKKGVVASFAYIPENVPSYILIGGIPFAPLSDHYKHYEYVPKHIVFNIKDESVLKSKIFKEMVGKAIAYEGFMVSFAGGRQFDPNVKSQYEAHSVLPANTTLEPFKIFYQPERWAECEFFPGVSIQTLIWRAVEMIGDDSWDPSLASRIIPQTHPEYASLLTHALNEWMAPKNRTVSSNDLDSPDPELSVIADAAVKAYWEAGKFLGIQGFTGEISGVAYGGSGRAFFDKHTRTVHLFNFGTLEMDDLVYRLVNGDRELSVEYTFTEAGPLSHEIEHARRNENASRYDPPHSPFTGTLWPTDRKANRSFVECQVDVYRKITSEGNFWMRFRGNLAE